MSVNTWEQDREYVMRELKRLGDAQSECDRAQRESNDRLGVKLDRMKDDLRNGQDDLKEKVTTGLTKNAVEISALKVKAGVWGGLAGILGAIGTAVVFLLKH